MKEAGYYSANIGHKELKFGEEYLASLIPYIDINLLNWNYVFKNAALKKRIRGYKILSFGNQRVGITGLGPKIPEWILKIHIQLRKGYPP